MSAHSYVDTSESDHRFVFDFRAAEDPGVDQRFSTWLAVEPSCRGPEPRPDWVVTSQAALDTELGVLKTGKEADVHLLERAVGDDPHQRVVMAAKRYRSEEHRSFWLAGVPVPYPVQIDGTEILMELVTVDGQPAPRLSQTRPDAGLLAGYYDQLRDAMAELARHGVAHGDLSAYNLLAAGDRLVVIDLPQAVDIVANPAGSDVLMRDCHNVCSWFAARGLDVDEHDLFGELVASAW